MAESSGPAPRLVRIEPQPLTPEAFAPYGKVLDQGRFVLQSTEFPFFTNIATLQPAAEPITYVNRHHDHNQVFATFGDPMIVIVARPEISAAALDPSHVEAFYTSGQQGIVFAIDTWHLAPRAAGPKPIRALNVQATNNHVHTERVELQPTFGCLIALNLPNKARLRERIQESRARLEHALGRLSEEQLLQPGSEGWSTKDHLAHLAAWEESLLARYEGRDRYAAIGIDSTTAATGDVDTFNAIIYRQHRDRSLTEVLAMFRDTHARVLTLLDRLSEADLFRPYSHFQPDTEPYDARPSAAWIVGNTWEHDDEHAEQIERMFG